MSEFLSFHLSDDFLKKYEKMEPEWGFDIGGGNSLSELTFIAKYSRKKEDGSKERWYEVCQRCIEGMYSILKDHAKYQRTPWNEFKAQKSAQDAYERMFHFKWTPPGRGLQHMGTEYIHTNRNGSRLINCSAISTEKISTHSAYEATMPFVRLMEMSMSGIGVGVDCRGAGRITLHQPSDETEIFVVPDTREGWAASLGKLLESFFFKNRKTVKFDYSEVRPEGAPLKSFSGAASGPDPLRRMHEQISELLSNREGELLTSRDIVDITNLTGKATVAGGSRRSALISFGEIDDEDYVNLKNWELEENAKRTGMDGWAWASNNSVLANSGDDLSSIIDKIAINGEPGILWVDLMRKYGRLEDVPNDRDYRTGLTNPCLSGDTLIAVADGRGAVPIRELAESGDDVPVYSMDPRTGMVEIKWGRHPRLTRSQTQVVQVSLEGGGDIRVTPDHKFPTLNGTKAASELQVGDRLVEMKSDRTGSYEHDLLSVTTHEKCVYALRDCEGCGKQFAAPWNQRERAFCSDDCTVDYSEVWDHFIGSAHDIPLESRYVVSVTNLDTPEDVYNITVDDHHTVGIVTSLSHNELSGIFVAQCGEIGLEGGGELCNLSELYPMNHDSIEDFKRTIKHAYMYCKAVTLLPTPWMETNEIIIRNRRIGVSMTGIAEFVETRGWSEIKDWMDVGYRHLVELDKSYSEWLGVRESIKLSTVKPAGSTSLLAATTSGVHWPTTSGHFIRRIRFSKVDPLVDLLAAAGYRIEDDRNDPKTTVVAEFPTTGVKVRSERDVSVWEKAQLAALAQRYWSDNLVSCTLSFTKAEQDSLGPLLASMDGQLKSASFLPIDESGTTYEQAPYEPLDSDVAVQMQKKIKPLNTAKLYASGIDAKDEKFCNTDSCEISFG